MNNIDKMFRNKLEHLNMDVPEGAWDNIASRLPKQKHSFTMWWAVIPGILLMLGAYSAFTFFNNKHLGNIKINDHKEIPIATNIKKDKLGIIKHANLVPEVFSNSFQQDDKTLKTSIIPKNSIKNAENNSTENTNASNILSLSKGVSLENNRSEASFWEREIFQPDVITNPLNNRKLKYSRAIRMEMPLGKEKPAKACPFIADYQDKSVDIYFSNDFPIKYLAAVSPEFEGYKNMRRQTEKTMYSFSAGARFGYNLSYKWNLHTGFNFSQINEKFEYIDPESNQTRIITIKDYIYTNGKITDSIITEELVIIPGTTKLKVYNKFRSFDIPLIGRYTLLANKNLSLSAMAGIYFNLSHVESGMILDTDNSTPISIFKETTPDDRLYKSQLGLSGYGALSLAYHLTSSLDFLLEPNIRFQTESMTTAEYPLKQYFNTFGVSTGLRYKF